MQRIMFSALMAVAVVIMQAQAAGLPRKHMIASSHPLATEAGAQVLKRGGSALDAAIAAQLVMGLVEPQSSGIGGGAFLLHWDAKVKKVESYDGRETAPLAAGPDLFLGPDGKPMPFMMTVVGGKSVGVPGVMAMLEMAHREHGALPWASLFAPAIALAENGFPVSERLAAAIAADPAIAMIPETAAYFRPNGVALKAGDIVVNKAYAQSLIALRDQGAKALVEGPLAQAIIETVRTAPLNPGGMTLGDLASYRPIKREPVCGTYRKHRICSMGLPSSGAVTMLQTLAFLERHRLAVLPPGGAQEVHLYGEASRLAYADRDAYLGDPEAMTVAVKDMLAPGYLTARGALIRRDQALPEVEVADDRDGREVRRERELVERLHVGRGQLRLGQPGRRGRSGAPCGEDLQPGAQRLAQPGRRLAGQQRLPAGDARSGLQDLLGQLLGGVVERRTRLEPGQVPDAGPHRARTGEAHRGAGGPAGRPEGRHGRAVPRLGPQQGRGHRR